ncbi:hypothetical protein M0R45_033553 [Rubus argutus]|uniref:Rhodanese domain-containing protein n=1 Tax=Rubus argutus TaxID=59490 RepID=A0AAW1WKW6_RUBAR
MEALNAASLTPISVLSDRKKEPRKFPSLPTISLPKFSNSTSFSTTPQAAQEGSSRRLHGGLLLLPSVFNAGFVTENPAIVAGGFAILAVPLVLSQVLKETKPWGVDSAKNAYAKLGEDANALLLDIRAPVEIRQVGSPDIRGLGKKAVTIVYRGEDKPGFLKKLSLKFKEPENTTLFILDRFDGNSELVAELVTVNGFKSAYAIKDGAEGPRGWVSSGLPWIPPSKVLSFDFGNLTHRNEEGFWLLFLFHFCVLVSSDDFMDEKSKKRKSLLRPSRRTPSKQPPKRSSVPKPRAPRRLPKLPPLTFNFSLPDRTPAGQQQPPVVQQPKQPQVGEEQQQPPPPPMRRQQQQQPPQSPMAEEEEEEQPPPPPMRKQRKQPPPPPMVEEEEQEPPPPPMGEEQQPPPPPMTEEEEEQEPPPPPMVEEEEQEPPPPPIGEQLETPPPPMAEEEEQQPPPPPIGEEEEQPPLPPMAEEEEQEPPPPPIAEEEEQEPPPPPMGEQLPLSPEEGEFDPEPLGNYLTPDPPLSTNEVGEEKLKLVKGHGFNNYSTNPARPVTPVSRRVKARPFNYPANLSFKAPPVTPAN